MQTKVNLSRLQFMADRNHTFNGVKAKDIVDEIIMLREALAIVQCISHWHANGGDINDMLLAEESVYDFIDDFLDKFDDEYPYPPGNCPDLIDAEPSP
jgi:hypothetical protein